MELLKTILKDISSLKAYYRFESGALTTDSAGAYTLTNNNTVGEGTGVFGGAATQGTSNTNKSLTRASDLGIQGGAVTLACWVKLNTEISSGLYAFMNLNSDTSDVEYSIRYNYNSGTRQLNFYRYKNPDGSDARVSYNVTMGTSNWYHLALAYDGSTLFAYVNGACVGSVTQTGNGSGTTTTGFSIGSRYDNGSQFASAQFDDVAIFNTALSADQIKELYEGRILGEGRPQTGLVALYHLNGHSTDFSGNNNHGTDSNTTYGQAYGKFGQGLSLGASTKIAIGNNAGLNIQANPVSVAFWIKTTEVNSRVIFSNYVSSNTYMEISIRSGKANFETYNGASIRTASTKSINDGVWHYIVFVRSAGTVNVYVDGVLDGTNAGHTTGAISTIGEPFYIGSAGNSFTGYLDEFSFYNVAKSASWVRQQYALMTGRLE